MQNAPAASAVPLTCDDAIAERCLTATLTMIKPTPDPIDPDKLVELAQAVIAKDHFPNLATIDGDQPRQVRFMREWALEYYDLPLE